MDSSFSVINSWVHYDTAGRRGFHLIILRAIEPVVVRSAVACRMILVYFLYHDSIRV